MGEFWCVASLLIAPIFQSIDRVSTINEFLMAENCFSVGVFDLEPFDFLRDSDFAEG